MNETTNMTNIQRYSNIHHYKLNDKFNTAINDYETLIVNYMGVRFAYVKSRD